MIKWIEMSGHGCKVTLTHLCKGLLWKGRVDVRVGSTMELLPCISFGTLMVLPSAMAASALDHWRCCGDGSCPRRDGPNWPNLFLAWGLVLVGFFCACSEQILNLQFYIPKEYSHYAKSSFVSLLQLIICSGKEAGESIETVDYCMLSHSLSTECPSIFKIYY